MPIIADVYASEGPTLDQLITEVITSAQGFTIAQDQVYALDADITDAALAMTIPGAEAPGTYEVDNELIRVISVDSASGLCTIHPSGRGWLGSTPTAHTAGAIVTEDPAFPRVRVMQAINKAISELYPRLYGVGSLDTTMGSTSTVELPSDAEGVLDVRYLEPISGEYQRVRTWELENQAADTTTGRCVLIPRLTEGDAVRVVYSIRPERFATGDQFWSDTGLPLSIQSLVQTYAISDIVRYIDVGRFTNRGASPIGQERQPQVSLGMQLSRSMRQDFDAQLDREAQALRNRFPARQHFTR